MMSAIGRVGNALTEHYSNPSATDAVAALLCDQFRMRDLAIRNLHSTARPAAILLPGTIWPHWSGMREFHCAPILVRRWQFDQPPETALQLSP